MSPANLTRRRFGLLTLSALAGASCVHPPRRETAGAGRKLDLRIGEGFGDANAENISAVLRSAGEEIWKHCPNTRWEVPGFFIFHSNDSPITLFDHRSDGRVAIGLNVKGSYWAQFAYQFAHEFCHALSGHTNDWRQTWIKERKANHWLEESLCEAASIFAIRAMGKSWKTAPPYPNWKSYAESLAKYADDFTGKVAAEKGVGFVFENWFRENEAALRENPTLRDKNRIIAVELLPLFEASPAGWESIVFYNRCENRDAGKTLARHFADWSAAAPPTQREFIKKIATVFDVRSA